MGMIIQNGKQYCPVYGLPDDSIKALPTVDTASGSVATFDTDMTENLVEVECEIIYQQASGTPTPQDEKPIGVYDSLTLYHNDINLWCEVWELGSINASGNTPSTSNIRTVGYIKVKPDTTYYIKCPNMIYIWQYDISKTVIGSTATGKINTTFTTGATTEYIRFRADSSYGTTYNNDISINYPSTDTQYHAFNGAYIPFGQTVAKGTLNVTTGVLRFNKGAVTLDGTQPDSDFSLSAMTGFTRINYIPYNDIGTISATFVSNIFEYVSSPAQYGEGKIWSNNTASRMFLGLPDTVTNKSQMQAWFSSNPTQVVFEYANEQVIQLSATQITALLNENNIWCDTGDTEVKYLLTVGKKIS